MLLRFETCFCFIKINLFFLPSLVFVFLILYIYLNYYECVVGRCHIATYLFLNKLKIFFLF